MQDLTSKQSKYLRGLGQRLAALAAIGKAGATAAAVEAVGALLARRELVKVHIPPGSGQQRQAMGDYLAQASGSTCVAVVGRMALLYRPNPDLPPEDRIRLP